MLGLLSGSGLFGLSLFLHLRSVHVDEIVIAVEFSVIDTLVPLDEKGFEFVSSSDDTASALNVGHLLLFLSLGDHLREGLG